MVVSFHRVTTALDRVHLIASNALNTGRQEGSIVDCFFNTQDHSLRFYTAMSGHDVLKLMSYMILVGLHG